MPIQKTFNLRTSFPDCPKNHIQKIIYASIDSEKAKQYLNDLARQVNKDPSDAKLQMEDGKVSLFSLSSSGLELDINKSLQILTDYFKNNQSFDSLELSYIEKKPEVDIDSIDNLGITTLIGEGRSNFRGSPKNRIFNIKVAANRFNGILIKPKEEFSFTKILGEVDGDHGYLEELVIKKDKTEPEFGGGICQVSTTAFRAAIYSGLEITARRNHAYPVSYYNPQGMDATVYVPRPDLRFINNTPAHILIQTKIEGTELIFDFYGTDDGRKTEVIGPKITERNPDGSMKATFTQKVYDKNGKIILEDVFNSSYDSPSKYPHPGDVLTQKPAGWSDKEWSKYKKEHNTQ
ncbi:MAG: VanW family protein [Candidatus Moranbacteria bacterium]|nr:VanW family protein [Candidatus Moranbacteria bacterium]